MASMHLERVLKLISSLASCLPKVGLSAFALIPADDNLFGIEARHFLYSRGRGAHFASALFFMLDVIRSVLVYSWQRYDCVIFVRYLMGTAYLPSPMHKFAYRFFALLVPKSDAMFFLDITPEVAYRRIHEGRKMREMFEDIGSLKDVRAKGLSFALIGAWTIIDADRTPSEVELEIRKHLRLGQSPAALPPTRSQAVTRDEDLDCAWGPRPVDLAPHASTRPR